MEVRGGGALGLARQVADGVQGTVLLVGSYARGDFREDSDIDVLVIALRRAST
jgi:predicted nucleotidyltransferase